ncbi:hypothetical protein BKG69_15945 [Mycobacteroides chelonae]|uniref:hypothetical protein n=1 Tax=Mycobacteroides chelonae TaxID=1774 RepID=UPI0008A9EEC0|nr:hypothetical protein [Mycobacteroides chelonae]OHT78137.1 hypothetical protein BKG69_15945 [Mycobacteroides chelonae]
MYETDPNLAPESVSALALDVLDELRMRMLECLLVLQALPEEAGLNFDEIENDIHTVQRGMRNAYGAASLVHQGAALGERWGSGLSRPKAIFARHNAAVREGARHVKPLRALSDRIERHLWQLPAVDATQNMVGTRPKCSGFVRATGDSCASSAIYLGSGMFGAHCYSHASPAERDRYRAHHEEISLRQSDSREELVELQRSIGHEITAHWIDQREQRVRWVEQVTSVNGRIQATARR